MNRSLRHIKVLTFLAGLTLACQHSVVAFGVKDSCEYTVKGKILDAETKEPIPFVTIKVRDSEKFTLSELNGEFFIDGLCQRKNTLIISCFGYCDSVCEMHYKQGEAPNIYLTEEVSELDAIEITTERNKEEGTFSISQKTIKSEELLSSPTQSLAAALSNVEGVSFTSAGSNVQLPVIHGLYGNRVLVLNNGMKHGFQNWGNDHAPEIDISSANSITVVKGAAGVRYGPEALGGAIIIEADPLNLNQPFFGKTGAGYETNGRGYNSAFNFGQGSSHLSYHVGGSYTKIGDRHSPDYSLTNSGKEEKSINAGLRYHLSDWDFKIYYSYIDQHLALLRASIAESGDTFIASIDAEVPRIVNPFSYEIDEPNQRIQHHLGKIEVDWRYSDLSKITFRAGQQLNKREEYDVRRNAYRPITDLDLITNDYQLEWTHPSWNNWTGLIGVQLFTQNNDNNPGTGTTPFIPNYNTFRLSGFVMETLEKDKNIFELGLRVDYENNNVRGRETNQDIYSDDFTFSNVTSSIGFIREISDKSTFRSNFGIAWRPPNMAELYSFGQHGFKYNLGLLRYYSDENDQLKSEEVLKLSESTVSSEKGYKWINEWTTNKNSSSITVTAFANYIKNFIFERPFAVLGTRRGPMPYFIYSQANVFLAGTDFTWQKKWSNRLDGTYSISYLWSRNIERNETLINQPPIKTSYKLKWKMPEFWKLSSSIISVKPSYAFQQFQAPRTVRPEELIDGTEIITLDSEIFDFMDAPEGYFLLAIAWTFDLGHWQGSIASQNTLNTRYRDYLNEMRYFAADIGRNISLTINYKF